MAHVDDFIFVNTSNPDRFRDKDIQRTIRKRVMRDIGKARRKSKHTPAVTFVWQPSHPSTRLESPAPCLGSNPLPVEIDSRALELIHFMNAEAGYNYRPFRKIWFSMALSDRSAFILCKANAAMFLEETQHPDTFRYETCQETLTYYGQCVRQVTERLSNAQERTSEGILTCILGLICHDLYVGTLNRWTYHIQGLALIIKIRGGFHGLDERVQLFASWFDVLGSVTKDALPNLPSCSVFLDDLAKDTRAQTEFEYLLDDLERVSSDFESLATILRRVRVLAEYINNRCSEPGFWKAEDDISPLQVLAPITHELLSMPRADELTSGGFENFCEIMRLALLILLCGVKTVYGLSAVEMPTLQNKFNRLIGYTKVIHQSFPFQRLQLWALVTVAMLQPSGPGRDLLIGKTFACMRSVNLSDGQSIVEAVQGIIWIDIIAKDKVGRLIHDMDSGRA